MKTLRITTVENKVLEGTIYNLTRHIKDFDDYYLFKDNLPNLDNYRAVWCYTDSNFTREKFPFTFNKLEKYQGQKINWNCAENIRQDIMTKRWIENDLVAPEFLSFLSDHTFQSSDLPEEWDYPLMIKAAREYPRVSFATIVLNEKEVSNWRTLHAQFPYMLQRYLPFDSPDGLYYCGQAYIIGNEVIPRSLRWTNHWYVSPTYRGEPHLGLEMGSFEKFPFYEQAENTLTQQILQIASIAKVDIGTLDFSLREDGQIIPWGICTVYPYYTEGRKSRESGWNTPSALEQISVQTLGWNKTLKYLGIQDWVSDNEIWRSIQSLNVNL